MHVENKHRLGAELRAGRAEVPGANRSHHAIGRQIIRKQWTSLGAGRLLNRPAAGHALAGQHHPSIEEFSMISTKLASIGLAAAFAVTLPAVQVQAQAPRTFVSAAGNDSNPCSFAAPCRHFQAAVDATSAGGEVDALDPAGYGPITISRAVTIEGQGWSYIAPPANGNGITINAVSGNVAIHGVSLNGAGITGGTNGIVFNSGDALEVTNCVAQNFTNNGSGTTGIGILIQPTSGTVKFAVTDTTASNNAYIGIAYQPASGTPSAIGVIDRVAANDNTTRGIMFYTGLLTTNSASTAGNVSNSLVSGNGQGGVHVEVGVNTSVLKVSIDNVTAVGNGEGIVAATNSLVVIGRSTITGNGTGVNYATNTLASFGNNQFNQNNADFFPAPPPPVIATR
jgi:hypothetical protein